MKLTSNWSIGKVYWRTFNEGDTVYMVGNVDGFLSNGQSIEYNHPSEFFQLEIKRGDISGSFLVHAGKIFNNEDELILTDKGELAAEADLADVQIDPDFKFEFAGSSAPQFFSLLNSSIDSEYEITTSLSQDLTTGITNSSKSTISVTDTTGGKANVEVTGGNAPDDKTKTGDPLKWGAKVSGEVSSSVQNKIEQAIENSFSFKSAMDTTYTEKHKVVGKAGKITVYTYSWQRKYISGKVSIGQKVNSFEATLGYITSEKRDEFNSVSALPADLRAQYDISFSSQQVVTKQKSKIIGLGNKCIDAAGASKTNGTPIILWDENDGINQSWEFDGELIVSSMDSNKCLDIQGGIATNGTPIILWEKNGGANQKWVYNQADGSFISALNQNMCIDVRGNETKNGAVIQLWEKNGGDNQKWHLG